MSYSSSSQGGLKGLIQKTGKFFFATAVTARDYGKTAWQYGYQYGGRFAFIVATSSMVTLVPLMFEVAREAQVRHWLLCRVIGRTNSAHIIFSSGRGSGTSSGKGLQKQRILDSTASRNGIQ